MIPTAMKIIAMTALWGALYCNLVLGQAPPVTILTIDTENAVNYSQDVSDIFKYATDPNVTTRHIGQNFFFVIELKDIVAVNGRPAKGTYARHNQVVVLSTNPAPGQAIADTVRQSLTADTFEILTSDGNPIGTIVGYGLGPGAPPLGASLSVTQGNFAITGGTGAFLAVRGQYGQAMTPQTIPNRLASITEDPADRRKNGGGRQRFVLQVIPTVWPQIIVSAGFPAFPLVTHLTDSSLVTGYNPATAGETLRLFVTGLGPTKPGIDPGQPFPANPLAIVNSLVEVTVNGKSATVLAAAGLPGAVDRYYVDFQVPSDTAKGIGSLQISAAWIQGPTVSIPIQ
jgi:uncharacterized protein (TIGR03437 family)